MRILTGKYKYQKIELAKNALFSPIITATRESIFSILNNYLDWSQVNVCDLFAGSGILGFEALSWNSRFCFFNDISLRYSEIIKQNCDRLQIKNADVSCNSYSQFLLQLKAQNQLLDLVFIDPPFQKVNLVFASIDLLLAKKLLNQQAIIVVRTNQKMVWNQYAPSLSILQSKVYGQHYLYFLQMTSNVAPKSEFDLKKSHLLVVSGPSGVGKKAIIQSLLANKELNLAYSTSVTTRPPRTNEKDGTDYHFFSVNAFEKAIARNDFLEYAKYLDQYYGSSKTYVQNLIDQGKNVLFEIELEGAITIKKQFPQTVWIFLFPPSYEELRRRIEQRGTETVAQIDQRLAKAQKEMQQVREHNLSDFCLINDSQRATIEEIVTILKKEWKK